jgi:hypothetical protein
LSLAPIPFDPEELFASIVGPILLAVGIAYAGNVYLLLGVFSLTGRKEFVERCWRNRLLLDFLIGTVVFGSSLLFRRELRGFFGP